MKFNLFVCIGTIIFFSCNHSGSKQINLKELNQNIEELEEISKSVVSKFIIGNHSDSLYKEILKRYNFNDFYSIDFLQTSDTFQYKLLSVPFFTLAYNNQSTKNYTLKRDSLFIKSFLIHNDMPFAEGFFRFDEVRHKYSLDYIQGIRKKTWPNYIDKVEQGYSIFMCNLKINDGTLFLPYIFYINENDEIIAHSWLKDFELTIEEVVKKHLR